MRKFMVQVQLGSHFVDLSVEATSAERALAAARAMVAADDSLRLFRHRFTNYVV
jgi:hypothetical protein